MATKKPKNSIKEEFSEEIREEEDAMEESVVPLPSLADMLLSVQAVTPQEDAYPLSEDVMNHIEMIRDAKNLEEVLNIRRKIRYRLFHIRQGGRMAEVNDLGLKAFIESQFSVGMTWSNFTFAWDVAPNDPLKVIPESITNYEWLAIGGKFLNDKKTPPAFTHQA